MQRAISSITLLSRLTAGAALLAAASAYAQSPQFSFFARRDIQVSSPAFLAAVGVADFNGDGIMDIAAADAIGQLKVMIGTGHLTYTTAFYAAAGEPETLVIGD